MAILYKSNETDFTTLGLGPLNDAASILVTEERNGQFELVMKYPVTGQVFKELKLDRLIKAGAGHKLKDQRFRIVRISKPLKGLITVYAEHISYLTADLALRPSVFFTGDAETALMTWKANLIDSNPFLVSSDITTTGKGTWTIDEVDNPRRALGGVRGSILDIYGGEYLFDNYHIRLMKSRGLDSTALIAYGRNLTELTQEDEISETYTSIYPYANNPDDEGENKLITLPEFYIDSEHVNKYARRKIFAKEFSEEKITTVDQLRKVTKKFIKDNDVGVPKVNMKLKYIDLAQTLEYKDRAIFEEVNLCDNIPVYFEDFDVNTKAKVIKTVWDDLREHYDSVELGQARSSLTQSVTQVIDGKLEGVDQRLNIIQIGANGKNRNFRGPDEPKAGMQKGDLWYQPVGAGEVMLHRFDGAYWKLEKVSAGLLSGELDAENGDVDLINVNVNTLVGNISSFMRSYWNGINKRIQIDPVEMVATNIITGETARITSDGEFISKAGGADLSQAYLRRGRLYFRNTDGTATLNAGAHPIIGEGNQQASLAAARSTRLYIGRFSDYLPNNPGAPVDPYISLQYAGALGDESRGFVKLHKFLSMSGQYIEDVQRITGYELAIRSSYGKLVLGGNNTGEEGSYNTLELGYASALFNGNINFAPGYGVTTTSDERLKNVIGKTKSKGLPEIRKLDIMDYYWKFGDFEKQMGLIAQKTPFLATQNEDGTFALLDTKHRMLNTLGIQELDRNAIEDRKNVTKQNKLLKEELQQTKDELKDLKDEFEELKAQLAKKGVI